MHIYTHLINSPKIESNARFLVVHKGYLKEIILSPETAHQRNNRTSGRKRLYDPLPGINDDGWSFHEMPKARKTMFFFLPLRVRSNLRKLKIPSLDLEGFAKTQHPVLVYLIRKTRGTL